MPDNAKLTKRELWSVGYKRVRILGIDEWGYQLWQWYEDGIEYRGHYDNEEWYVEPCSDGVSWSEEHWHYDWGRLDESLFTSPKLEDPFFPQ